MPRIRTNIDYNKIYTSNNSGDFIIVKELESRITHGTSSVRQILIRFLKTGYETITTPDSIIKGCIKDPYYPSIFGVACIGKPKTEYTKKEYDMWFNMIKRCYYNTDPAYNMYGAKGVTVDPRWHCFEYFLEDLKTIPGSEILYSQSIPESTKNSLSLDKDYLQQDVPIDKKIYSKDTCILTPIINNIRLIENNSSSKYKGVHKLEQNRSYQASINVNGKKYFLGTFDNDIAAANVYNAVASQVFNTYQNIPYMDIKEALSHRTSTTPLKLPPGVRFEGIAGNDVYLNKYAMTNVTSIYNGVHINGNKYISTYCTNNNRYTIGAFSNEIAAANAHNWFVQHLCSGNGTINKVKYMPPEEWVSYRISKNKDMCIIKNK